MQSGPVLDGQEGWRPAASLAPSLPTLSLCAQPEQVVLGRRGRPGPVGFKLIRSPPAVGALGLTSCSLQYSSVHLGLSLCSSPPAPEGLLNK